VDSLYLINQNKTNESLFVCVCVCACIYVGCVHLLKILEHKNKENRVFSFFSLNYVIFLFINAKTKIKEKRTRENIKNTYIYIY